MSIWDPSRISTALWLDADDVLSITADANGISQWADKSGNSRHAIQSTNTNKPNLLTSGLNNKNVIAFDGVDDKLNGSWDVALTSQTTFAVFLYRGNKSSRVFTQNTTGEVDYNSTGHYIPIVQNNTNTSFCSFAANQWVSPADVSVNTPCMFNSVHTGSTIHNRVNGGSAVSTSHTLNTSFNQYTIGGNTLTDSIAYLEGYVAEIIVLDYVVDDYTRQLIEGYLAWKWGLVSTLPTDHPYKNIRSWELGITAKSVILDIADTWFTSGSVAIRSVEFLLNGEVVPLVSNFQAYATSYNPDGLFPSNAFNTSLSKTGERLNNEWFSGTDQYTNQRLIVVFDSLVTFDQIHINNGHAAGVNVIYGAKNTKITISSDTITDTTYNIPVTNGTVLFDGQLREHILYDTPDPLRIWKYLTPEETYRYPPQHTSTYVKATDTLAGDYYPYYATDPAKSLIGVTAGNGWASDNTPFPKKYNIDHGDIFVPTVLYIDNYHEGNMTTALPAGIKDITVYGTNSETAFNNTVGSDLTNLTLIGTFTVDKHVVSDVPDPQYFDLVASGGFRYTVTVISSNYGYSHTGIRRIAVAGREPEATLPITGESEKTLDNVSTEQLGEVAITGVSEKTLANIYSYSSDGLAPVFGVSTALLGSIDTEQAGLVIPRTLGVSTTLLEDAVSEQSGLVFPAIVGQSNAVLSSITVENTGNTYTQNELSQFRRTTYSKESWNIYGTVATFGRESYNIAYTSSISSTFEVLGDFEAEHESEYSILPHDEIEAEFESIYTLVSSGVFGITERMVGIWNAWDVSHSTRDIHLHLSNEFSTEKNVVYNRYYQIYSSKNILASRPLLSSERSVSLLFYDIYSSQKTIFTNCSDEHTSNRYIQTDGYQTNNSERKLLCIQLLSTNSERSCTYFCKDSSFRSIFYKVWHPSERWIGTYAKEKSEYADQRYAYVEVLLNKFESVRLIHTEVCALSYELVISPIYNDFTFNVTQSEVTLFENEKIITESTTFNNIPLKISSVSNDVIIVNDVDQAVTYASNSSLVQVEFIQVEDTDTYRYSGNLITTKETAFIKTDFSITSIEFFETVPEYISYLQSIGHLKVEIAGKEMYANDATVIDVPALTKIPIVIQAHRRVLENRNVNILLKWAYPYTYLVVNKVMMVGTIVY